ANRRYLTEVLVRDLARARREKAQLAVLYCDIDSFKRINDQFGHATGDRVLTVFAEVLRRCLREGDTAARYGGDEFVCLLHAAGVREARNVARRIRAEFSAGMMEVGLSTALGASSAGIAIFPRHAADADSLLDAADAALLRAKAAGTTVELAGEP